jgi:TRAP-type C4-dicarboxylate transport system permease large subunit
VEHHYDRVAVAEARAIKAAVRHSGITNISVVEVVRAALPWLGILLIFLILITYVPAISTFLPNLLYGP